MRGSCHTHHAWQTGWRAQYWVLKHRKTLLPIFQTYPLADFYCIHGQERRGNILLPAPQRINGTKEMDDRLSIKNLLFTKSIPNYEIPAPVDGHNIFSCTDCGDKFIFESSFNDHLGRKSMQITYLCRFCNQTKLFFNRCMLLFHIRSHAFKTATINVNDLKVEPLPLNFFKATPINKPLIKTSPQVTETSKKQTHHVCYECKQHMFVFTGTNYKDRASHYMQYTNEVHTCPVCLFALPTICALRAHVRFHLGNPPFFCPECGIHLPVYKRKYPYGHDCEGFKMMRATTRLKCPAISDHLFHPNDYSEHMKVNHLKRVYKCPHCVVACFNEGTMNKHLETHNKAEAKSYIFYQCELCPGKLVGHSNIDNHLRTHKNAPTFPCWTCGCTFKDVCGLLYHHIQKHASLDTAAIKNMLNIVVNRNEGNLKRIYRVVKKCDQCHRNFTYKCNFNEISVLPTECPFKCSNLPSSFKTIISSEPLLTCHFCKDKMSQNWEDIKKHYALKHKTHKCLDLKVVLEKLDLTNHKKKKTRLRNATLRKVKPKKRRQNKKPEVRDNGKRLDKISGNYCSICELTCNSKEELETHFLSHKDPCMAYQCMECGQSFVVKPSFATHLMLEHGISKVDEYIVQKNQCYNEIALKNNQSSELSLEPLKEHQCKICREQFNNSEELTKHFRGHGMAFLLKSTFNKNVI